MAKKNQATRSDITAVESLVNMIAQNKPASPQEFLKQGLNARQKALTAYEALSQPDALTGEPADPFIAAIAKVLIDNEDEAREEILKLVYKGEIDPMAYYEMVMALVKTKSPVAAAFQDLRKVNLKDARAAKGCAVCSACSGCVLCAACGVSGTIAAGAAGMAGAAGAYLA